MRITVCLFGALAWLLTSGCTGPGGGAPEAAGGTSATFEGESTAQGQGQSQDQGLDQAQNQRQSGFSDYREKLSDPGWF